MTYGELELKYAEMWAAKKLVEAERDQLKSDRRPILLQGAMQVTNHTLAVVSDDCDHGRGRPNRKNSATVRRTVSVRSVVNQTPASLKLSMSTLLSHYPFCCYALIGYGAGTLGAQIGWFVFCQLRSIWK